MCAGSSGLLLLQLQSKSMCAGLTAAGSAACVSGCPGSGSGGVKCAGSSGLLLLQLQSKSMCAGLTAAGSAACVSGCPGSGGGGVKCAGSSGLLLLQLQSKSMCAGQLHASGSDLLLNAVCVFSLKFCLVLNTVRSTVCAVLVVDTRHVDAPVTGDTRL
jgi:hypothetical protein